jgi:glycerophosphoryl diester phosphodiesterase
MPASRLAPLLSLTAPAAIAHRGGGKLRPENTLEAFARAVACGVDAIECDVRLSRDREVVVVHDEMLERTTNASGPVAALTASALARVDAGWHFGADQGFPHRGRGIGIPRLVDALAQWPDVPFIVEIKGDRAEDVPIVLGAIGKADAFDRVIVGGFSGAVLQAVRERRGGITTSASLPEVRSALRRSWLNCRPKRTGFDVFQVPMRFRGRRVLTRTFVRAARRAHVPVQVWVVDEADEMRMLLDWGVTGLISDRPDVAVQVARESERR